MNQPDRKTAKDSRPFYAAWQNWSGNLISFRLSLLLIAGMLVMLPWPQPDAGSVMQFVGLVAAYVITVTAIQKLLWRKQPDEQGFWISLCMMCAVSATALIFENTGAAILLLLPAVNGALRVRGRSLTILAILLAVSWVGIHIRIGGDLAGTWQGVLAGLLPLLLSMAVIRALKSDMDTVRYRLTALSYRDELTGTLNMRAFSRLLQTAHEQALGAGSTYALLMVDVQGLQQLNDEYGHEQGSRALLAVADALKRSVTNNDLVARYGGDEFIVYLAGANAETAEEAGNRIAQNVYNITLSFARRAHRIQVNVGVGTYPEHGSTHQAVMAHADRAMYQDKEFRRRTASGASNQGATAADRSATARAQAKTDQAL